MLKSSLDNALIRAKLSHSYLVNLTGDRASFVVLLYVALLSVLLLLANRLLRSKKSNKTVLIVGACGAGKTRLLHMLCKKKVVSTVTSMKASSMHLSIDGSQCKSLDDERPPRNALTVIDYPGHERLRADLKLVLSQSSAIIFVIDCADLTTQVRKSGELLYDILTDSSINRCNAIAIACNKVDIRGSKPDKVKLQLAKELEHLRTTRTTVGMQGEDNLNLYAYMPLGRKSQPLDFDVDAPCPIKFVSCSSECNEGVVELRKFIAEAFK